MVVGYHIMQYPIVIGYRTKSNFFSPSLLKEMYVDWVNIVRASTQEPTTGRNDK